MSFWIDVSIFDLGNMMSPKLEILEGSQEITDNSNEMTQSFCKEETDFSYETSN